MKILFVDDDRDAIEHFIEELRNSGGHTVTKVDTIQEAEQELAKPSWPFDLLILDVQMRPGDAERRSEEASLSAGLTFYYKFRKKFRAAKVVILTNNLFRVPTALVREDSSLRAWDKVAVAGRLSEEIHRSMLHATKP